MRSIAEIRRFLFREPISIRLQRKTASEPAVSSPVPFLDEGDIVEVEGLKAIYLGRDLKDPYQGNMLFFLEKQSDESPSLVSQKIKLGKKTGRATPEQLDLVKEELDRIRAKTKPSMSS